MATEGTSKAAVQTGAGTGAGVTSPRVDRKPAVTRDAESGDSGGRTTIADSVVAKIAGIAAREVPGVHALGGGGARALGAVREVVKSTDLTQGIKVDVGETQAAADITIVVEYPSPIHEVAQNVRARVTDAITNLVGLQVVEVNVNVDDVHLPTDDADDDTESRVS